MRRMNWKCSWLGFAILACALTADERSAREAGVVETSADLVAVFETAQLAVTYDTMLGMYDPLEGATASPAARSA